MYSQQNTNFCDPELQTQKNKFIFHGDTYLKDFLISPNDLSLDDKNSKWSYKNTLVLSEKHCYRFFIKCSEKFPSEVLLTVKKIASTNSKSLVYLSQKYNEFPVSLAVTIEKTGKYEIEVTFKNNVKGCALLLLTLLGKEESIDLKKRIEASSQLSTTLPTVDTSQIYISVNEPARFKGEDINNFKNYVAENFHVDSSSMKSIVGKVYIQFVVNYYGRVEDIKILRSCGSSKLDEEAIRVLKASPLWEPAKQQGVKVKQQFVLPIKIN